MNKLISALAAVLILFATPKAAFASLIVTTPGNDSVLEAILDFDAGPLGIVDMDFGGISFNIAFGTDAAPAGFLFPTTSSEALAIITDIRDLLNSYNATAPTSITSVLNSIINPAYPTTWFLDIAYNVSPEMYGLHQTSWFGAGWVSSHDIPAYPRTGNTLNFARMTAAASAPVPVPATFALFGLGLAGLGWSRRKQHS